MLSKLRRRAQDEKGFTLIELLVVILIIGILAAIAIPSFLNQKSKANDAQAKEMVRTGQTAAETYATDHNGSYVGMTTAGLQALEPSLNDTSGSTFTGVVGTPLATSYSVRASSSNGNTYTIAVASGVVTRSCTPTSTGTTSGGCVGGTW